jgi:hypothetical protein
VKLASRFSRRVKIARPICAVECPTWVDPHRWLPARKRPQKASATTAGIKTRDARCIANPAFLTFDSTYCKLCVHVDLCHREIPSSEAARAAAVACRRASALARASRIESVQNGANHPPYQRCSTVKLARKVALVERLRRLAASATRFEISSEGSIAS